MKKLFKTLVLTIALMLPLVAFAEEANQQIIGEVVNENEGAPVEWVVTA